MFCINSVYMTENVYECRQSTNEYRSLAMCSNNFRQCVSVRLTTINVEILEDFGSE